MQGKEIPSDFWNKKFLNELKKSMGNVLLACRKLNITPQSYYNYRLKNPVFAHKATEIIDLICVPVLEDIASTKAMKGDSKLLMFFLRNRGGKRWSQDLVEAVLAKLTARLREQEEYKKNVLDEQKMPTKAQLAAARAYEEEMLKENDGDDDEHPDGCQCNECIQKRRS